MSSQKLNYPEFSLPDPKKSFLASEKTIYDYSHLYGFCSIFAKMCSENNISEDRPLALLSRSSDELIFVIAGCNLLKIPFIALNPDLTDAELRDQINIKKPGAFYTDSENRARADDYPVLDIAKRDLNVIASENTIEKPSSDPSLPFGYFFTSGSSGRPKLVSLLRRQIIFATQASAINFKPDPDRFWLLCLPLNHIGGISIVIRSILYHSAIFRLDSFDEDQIRTFLSENRLFQVASLVPTMLQRLLDEPLFQLHLEFKALLLGGGPVPDGLIDRALERGVPVVSSYGMTETCAQIAANPMLQPRGMYHPKKSVGTIFKPNEVQIRDPKNGSVQPPNEIGQIWLRGPQVIDSYPDPALNSRVFDENGWFNTGDIGHLNRRKQLFIKNRRTDRIITGGENVDPVEIEQILENFDGVIRAAVTGISDPEWGQKVVALLEIKDEESFDPEWFSGELKKRVSGYKIPKEYVPVHKIPTTSLGKIRRGELFKLYQKNEKDPKF
ncbi:hypothetical protein DYD21_19945 [Rhodohalobacter sp. SW132]|uniref:AMP-binding protein n=1 Tax=Rhodohalobacter sp. SW132 TaxID=2293433 RepID=UPI000E21C27B|nr:AMP-binding protein [Rhodohalobacter sp. SW132]REL24084.1 hypothetical protein DYD21_19945 [Rhodohalobacter sp. SW132]